MRSITIRAPSSTANLGPGFDVFGMALDAFSDTLTLEKADSGITVRGSGVPSSPDRNTAGMVAAAMIERFAIPGGVRMDIAKGVPVGLGMGSSAASAAAAAAAVNALYDLGLDRNTLVECAGIGERASAGVIHYDNVAASLLGGFVIVRTDPLDVIRIDPPGGLVLCLGVPDIRTPQQKTQVSRGAVPKSVGMSEHTRNLANAAAMVSGFHAGDPAAIGSAVRDAIVEPARRHMIPGFDAVRDGALRAGALGVTISGAGPSVISFLSGTDDADAVAAAMRAGFASAGVGSRSVVCRPGLGAGPVPE